MPSTTPEAIEKLKHAPEVAGVDDLIRRRWSPRAYSDKEIPRLSSSGSLKQRAGPHPLPMNNRGDFW